MKVECIINDQVRIILCPETDMESEILRQMMKQENTLTEIKSSIHLLGKTISHAVIIERKNFTLKDEPPSQEEEM